MIFRKGGGGGHRGLKAQELDSCCRCWLCRCSFCSFTRAQRFAESQVRQGSWVSVYPALPVVQLQDTTDALSCHVHLPVCLWIMDPHSRAPEKNTSHGNEVLPQDTTHLIQRPCYQRGSPCQDPAGNWTAWRSPDDRKETQTAVVWPCFPFIRSGQNHLARHSERGKKTRRTKEEVGRQHQGMDRPGVRQVPEGSGEQGKMEKTGCEIICGAPTTCVVKG